jgi:hypothetical protein
MFDEQPLIYAGDELRLGQKTLLRTDSSKGFSAIATQTLIFVSASQTLIVFDGSGREVCRAKPGRVIGLGSVGENQSTIYGVADGATIVRISAEDGVLHVEDVYDPAIAGN